MSTIDILLLEILDRTNTQLKIRELYNKLSFLEISCCAANIYRRLNKLKQKTLINDSWSKEGKVYSISETGKGWINEFKSKLKNEPESN